VAPAATSCLPRSRVSPQISPRRRARRRSRGIEAQILPNHPFRFHLLPMEPIYRRAWWRNLRWPAIAVRAWRAAGQVLRDEQPAIVIGTGGYAAGPVVWRAQRARIPTALQEQNAFPGLTQRMLARGARQVHLGFPEARLRLSPGSQTQVFVFGNPITPPIAVDASRPAPSSGWAMTHGARVHGSQGRAR
jgi:UDP-N-acetylglucosamine--N-acetylmuramyl-(pentapeptide) pyrophosphoryl-undecaprenol N-acetylglucosamine transferase